VSVLVQEVLPIQRIPLGRPKSRISNYAAQLFFGGAVGYACGSYYVFFQHHRAYVVAVSRTFLELPFQEVRRKSRTNERDFVLLRL
jgi:hypothetical protein